MRYLIILILAALFALPADARAEEEPAAALPAGVQLRVTFLPVGKADAILLQSPSASVLIDAGTDSLGPAICQRLQALGVEELDALFITHFDKDHVGGVDAVLRQFPVAAVYEPAYEKSSKQVKQYRKALKKARLSATVLKKNRTITLDGVRYQVDTANRLYYGEDEENDFSLVILAQCGQTRFLFTGDVENPRLGELLDEGDLAADVLKVPHHGKREKLSRAFFSAVRPSMAVITDSDESPADDAVWDFLTDLGCEVFSTRNGEVAALSDGQSVSWRQGSDREPDGAE